jgi:MerR family transcriptional regulator, Zn(II)-responsive regulator of zntA
MIVSEMARKSGVTSNTVRYYARVGLLKPGRDPRSQYRDFTNADLLRLRFIIRARKLGFKLSEIQDIFRHSESGTTPCPMVREIMERRLEENAAELDAAVMLRERMRKAIVTWNRMPDRRPSGDEICSLIEAEDW